MNEQTRVTLVLPADLWEDVKRLVPAGQRSKMVSEAIEIEVRRRQRLEKLGQLHALREKMTRKYGLLLPDSSEDIQAMRQERNGD